MPLDPSRAECRACRFFHPINGESLGECRRRAPRRLVYRHAAGFPGDHPGDYSCTEFPEVQPSMWCGEFGPRPVIASKGGLS